MNAPTKDGIQFEFSNPTILTHIPFYPLKVNEGLFEDDDDEDEKKEEKKASMDDLREYIMKNLGI